MEFDLAYILHCKPYRETSVLLSVLSKNHGKIACIAKGARQTKSSLKGLLQPFQLLSIKFQGRSEIKTLYHAEAEQKPLLFYGTKLFSALYLNELIYRLFEHDMIQEELFPLYHQTIVELENTACCEQLLRNFEYDLLNVLGFALTLDREQRNNCPIDNDQYYSYHADDGFSLCLNPTNLNRFPGSMLLQMAKRNFADKEVQHYAKRLFGLAIHNAFSHKPILSRTIFSRRILHEYS